MALRADVEALQQEAALRPNTSPVKKKRTAGRAAGCGSELLHPQRVLTYAAQWVRIAPVLADDPDLARSHVHRLLRT